MPQLFESAFTYAAIGMALVAPDGRWLRVNRSLCEIVGYSEQELLKGTFQDVTHPDDLDADLAYVGQMLRGEIETYQMEKRYLHKDGRIVWVLLSVSLAREETGTPRCFISQVQDITARKEAEQDLDIFFELPMLFRAIVTADGSFKRISRQWVEALGYAREELIAKPPLALVHPEDLERTTKGMRDLFEGRPVDYFEFRMRRADGSYLWLMSCAVSLPERQIAFVVATNITALKESEARALADAEEKRRLYEQLQQATQEVHRLQQDLVTVCAWTKQVRVGNEWKSLEDFLTERLHLRLSHGISDEAVGRMQDDLRNLQGRIRP